MQMISSIAAQGRTRRMLAVAAVAAAIVMGLAGPASAGSGFTLDRTVTGPAVPGGTPPTGQWCVDLSMVSGGVYYVSDASNRQVTRMRLGSGQLLRPLGAGLFTGPAGCEQFDFAHEGPQGLLVLRGDLWAGNGDSTVKVLDLASGRLEASISTGGTARADEMATNGSTVLVTNPDDPAPFLTLIDAHSYQVVRHLTIPGAVSLEQPVSLGGRWFVSVPATSSRPGGEIAVLAADGTLERTIPVGDCGPGGLAAGAGLLAVGCSPGQPSLLLRPDGTVARALPTVSGVDEVWFDPTRRVFDFGNFTGQGCQVVTMAGTLLGSIPGGLGFHACASWAGRWVLPVTGAGVQIWRR
jgi:hypothetical protein